MRAVVPFKIGKSSHKLNMNIGALEEIAEVNPCLVEVWGAFQTGVWVLPELKAVLAAGLGAAEEKITASDVIEGIGLTHAAKLAQEAMAAAFKDDSGK